MSDLAIGFTGVGIAILLLAARVPIAISLGLTSIAGIMFLKNFKVAFGTLETIPFSFTAHWSLSAIPMFILMGAIAHNSGISGALFNMARIWLSWLPGGLAVATNFACAGFAAASGSSMATAAAMGRLAVPEMLKRGYDKSLATSVVAASGTLGSLIPPSILLVLYGVFAEVSISKLLIAGIIPGLLTAFVYAAMLITRCSMNPELAPASVEAFTREEKIQSAKEVWPIFLLILAIIGGIYSGFVTPTEAAAFGAFMAIVITIVQGKFSWSSMLNAFEDALHSTSRLFFVAIGAVLLTIFLTMSGVPFFLADIMEGYSGNLIWLVLATSVIFIILGMFLDPLGLMLITLPILLPIYERLDLDLIWFGIIVVKYLEIGLLTPPVGFNVYVINSVTGDDVKLNEIFRGIWWFLGCEAVVVALLIAFPALSLYLPSLM